MSRRARRKENRRGDIGSFSLSFLDAICCGFGAIVLLLVLTKVGEPRAIETARQDLDGLIARLEEELAQIRGETKILNRELITQEEQLSEERQRIARLKGDLSDIQGEFMATRQLSEVNTILEGQLVAAQQELTEEMKRLQRQPRERPVDSPVGGIPVDSEYIIFIIDTSGSMRSYAWDRVQQQIRETLEVYPTVKGIQVLNDDGQYMFRSYRNEWIPDTQEQRDAILDRLRDWRAVSNSSPREGILAAIDTFYDPDKKISLYVYSDDFSAGAGQINAVVREVDRRNTINAEGEKRVRIHAVAFPVYYEVTGNELLTAADFAILMRALCLRNGGTFVALPSRRDI
jgi:hypothetical protein